MLRCVFVGQKFTKIVHDGRNYTTNLYTLNLTEIPKMLEFDIPIVMRMNFIGIQRTHVLQRGFSGG